VVLPIRDVIKESPKRFTVIGSTRAGFKRHYTKYWTAGKIWLFFGTPVNTDRFGNRQTFISGTL